MIEAKDYAVIGLGFLGVAQSFILFFKGRRDKEQSELRKAEVARMDGISNKLEAHITEDREMHERLQRAETKLENQQTQINESNARHGDLVKKLDEIQRLMLTKEDFKMLVAVIRGGTNTNI